jgi:hypothetical protein
MNIKVYCYSLPCFVSFDQRLINIEILNEKYKIPISYYLNKPFKIELITKKQILYTSITEDISQLIDYINFYNLLL